MIAKRLGSAFVVANVCAAHPARYHMSQMLSSLIGVKRNVHTELARSRSHGRVIRASVGSNCSVFAAVFATPIGYHGLVKDRDARHNLE